ncbi:MAG: TonB-dependent receptor [Rubrivivax sp.]|nr:TonB-dependent receptor [Rubrivivax sp.]
MELGEQWSLWAGLRHVRLDREGTPTGVGPGGAQPTRYDQSFTTPWVGLAWQATPATMLHASWGEGVETEVVPGLPVYANAGQPLPALRSRQVEAGVKHRAGPWLAAFTAFSITRPETTDECSAGGLCTRVVDGEARHRGIEAEIGGRQGSWTLQASAMWLDAERSGALVDPALNGLEPANVPGSAVKGRVAYDIAAWPGLQAIAAVVHEGPRQVLPDNTVRAAAWTRLDLAARWSTRMAGHDLSLLVALDNATDERAWRDTPYQFEHAYLFPLAPRTWRVSLQAGF